MEVVKVSIEPHVSGEGTANLPILVELPYVPNDGDILQIELSSGERVYFQVLFRFPSIQVIEKPEGKLDVLVLRVTPYFPDW